jgi:hypothetical protein
MTFEQALWQDVMPLHLVMGRVNEIDLVEVLTPAKVGEVDFHAKLSQSGNKSLCYVNGKRKLGT